MPRKEVIMKKRLQLGKGTRLDAKTLKDFLIYAMDATSCRILEDKFKVSHGLATRTLKRLREDFPYSKEELILMDPQTLSGFWYTRRRLKKLVH